MPRVRDLLYRFRPAGAPSSASAAGSLPTAARGGVTLLDRKLSVDPAPPIL
jgi:hypothetical protein